ncbi:PAAR domain-containing protein [Marinilabilia salmonicolor]|uniref:PAAR domain-containing protein n=1 Tax=Marinilabilia salmonicolor TaxID=989 RepID=UPI00029A256D|nr:PAAR domain-containing protein [Marinilabilia salmonicolor]
MPGPAATIGSMHVCPMLNPGVPPPPHVGGPVMGPGVPTVLIGGKPAAVMGDTCTCAGPPDTIVQGESTVLIGGKPAATVGSMTAHGGSVTVGDPTVLIGTGVSAPAAISPVKRIPFPDISPVLRAAAAVTGRGSSLKEAERNQKKLKEQAREMEEQEKEPRIYNLKWCYDEAGTTDAQFKSMLKLTAEVSGIDDGEELSFSVFFKDEKEDVFIAEVKGKVKDSEACAEWEFKKEDLPEAEQNATDVEELFFGNYYFTVSYE